MGIFWRAAWMRLLLWLLIAPFCSAAEATPASAEDLRAQQLVGSVAYQSAVAEFDRDYDRFVRELIFLTEIPAPPFKEQVRAEAYAKLLREVGLTDVQIDAEGNALGLWRGTGGGRRAPARSRGAPRHRLSRGH